MKKFQNSQGEFHVVCCLNINKNFALLHVLCISTGLNIGTCFLYKKYFISKTTNIIFCEMSKFAQISSFKKTRFCLND